MRKLFNIVPTPVPVAVFTGGCHDVTQQAAKHYTAASSLPPPSPQWSGGENWEKKSNLWVEIKTA